MSIKRFKKDSEVVKVPSLISPISTKKVKNNVTGKITPFRTMKEATEYQEHLVFNLGVDAEVL